MQLVICITAFKMWCFSPFFLFHSLIFNRVWQKDENVFSCCDISLFKEQLSPFFFLN